MKGGEIACMFWGLFIGFGVFWCFEATHREAIELCEAELPRDQHCVITAEVEK